MPRMTGRTMQTLMAETLARAEGEALAQSAPSSAYAAAAGVSGTQDRIRAFCAAHGDAAAARAAVRSQLRVLTAALLIGMMFAAMIGAAAARAGFSAGEGGVVNAVWLFGAVLGPNVLAFCVWVLLLAMGLRTAAVPGAGRVTVWISRQIARIGSQSRLSGAARRAALARLMGPPAGRWSLSAISHAVWIAFLAGALLAGLIMLSTRQYLFVWETTILPDNSLSAAVEMLASGPAALEFSVPDSAMIAAARVSGPGDMPKAADAPVWASFWIGSMLVYGLIPRLAVFLLSLGISAWTLRDWRLDLSHPGFSALVPRLAPVMRGRNIVDQDETHEGTDRQKATVPADDAARPHDLPPAPSGAVALLGWELDAPRSGWPPPGLSSRVQDLGLIDDRAALNRALETLGAVRPARVIVIMDMVSTPDRGVAAALRDIVTRAGDRVAVVLGNEAAAHDRLGDADYATRLRDWVSVAHEAGVPLEMITRVDLNGRDDRIRDAMGQISGRDDG